MKALIKIIPAFIIITLTLFISTPCREASGDSCASGVAYPPFLGSSSTPNLLIMIDNSASMYDLAEISGDDPEGCYDDSYNSGGTYAGYFAENTWYIYSFSSEQFQDTPEPSDDEKNAATYHSDDVMLTTVTTTTTTVTEFKARGNFLNWAAASKLDIEKKILTGGKYDSANQMLIMESRGCLNRRMVKEVEVFNTSGTVQTLTLGIIPPRTTSTVWTPGTLYSVGDVVTESTNANTLDEGTLYIAKTSGTSTNTSVATDGGVTWETYNTTHIEIFSVTTTGFEKDACQAAVDAMEAAADGELNESSLGVLRDNIDTCMGYDSGQSSSSGGNGNNTVPNYMAVFNHAIFNCWYKARHDATITGYGDIASITTACAGLYGAGVDPTTITDDDRGYVCWGEYDSTKDAEARTGYVGRCWIPSTSTWESDACVEGAMDDYCGVLQIPEVVDPTDQAGQTGDYWNMPAVLIDTAIQGQMGEPLAVMKGHIAVSAAPDGILDEYVNDIRMGVMVFNDNGSKDECKPVDPSDPIIYQCFTGNRDGGKIAAYIDEGAAHNDALIEAVNNIKANSWTPLGEAYYTAMKYYTRDGTNLLNRDLSDFSTDPDFILDTAHDPDDGDPCRTDNILIITEGASTMDLNTDVQTFITTSGQNDEDTEDTCTDSDLSAGTYLDDLTYYMNNVKETKTYIIAVAARNTGTEDECNPYFLLTNAATNGGTSLSSANDMSELGGLIEEDLGEISSDAASGSAASVISSSRGGEGAIYQAIFWPGIELDNGADPVNWVGEVHALLIDTYGNMYEDTGGDGALGPDDESVVIYFDTVKEDTMACYGTLNDDGTCNGTSKDLRQVKYLWSATQWLVGMTDTQVKTNRSSGDYISEVKQRYIFTWNDLDNDGIVDSNEQIPFEEKTDWTTAAFAVSGSRGPVPLDFGVTTTAEVNAVINWIRGVDQTGLRNRKLTYDLDGDGTKSEFTWRMGDVIHSTPVSCAAPAEGYHLLYGDTSYGNFVSQYTKRRHMVYFGANDGMLHAVNAGFYDTVNKKFMKTPNGADEETAPELGAELWAYVPYNLLAHLKCLTDTTYAHKYYVDQRPRIFDVKIFSNDDDHPDGWGTILVGAMRFGGAPVDVSTLDVDGNGAADYSTDPRTFISAYFILDVTNPEKPPVLLGEMTMNGTQADMGYTTGIPTVVPMYDNAGTTSKWYLVLGSGPTDVHGTSTQTGRVAVYPLDLLTAAIPSAFRIPTTAPSEGNDYIGSWTLPLSTNSSDLFTNSFVSDLITVDFDLEPKYRGDVVYFGSIGGTSPSWSGKLYRLKTRILSSGSQVSSTPDDWTLSLLIDAGAPITAAPTVGWDGANYWVCFGTGRYFHADERTESVQQTYYGIKEPLNCSGAFTWATVEKTGTVNGTPGTQGLLKVDKILVRPTGVVSADLYCKDSDSDCESLINDKNVKTFADLELYISGSGCTTAHPEGTGTDGWYREFQYVKERSLGQGALLGGLLTFTTFKPSDDACDAEGDSYLYGVYLKTGTSWYKPVFETIIGTNGLDGDGNIIDIVPLGKGLSTTPNLHVGKAEGSKAFVQTSTGAIIEIPQVNLPVDQVKTGRANWLELLK